MEEEIQGQPEEVVETPVEGTPVAQVAEVENVEPEQEEDPEAWRVTRWSDDSSEIAHQLNSLAERHPQFKRQLGMVAAQQGNNRQLREEKAQLAAELEAANEERKRLAFEVSHAKWGGMTREQIGQAVAKNPAVLGEIQEYAKQRQEFSKPRQQTPAYMTNMVLEAQDYLDRNAHRLPPEYEQAVREMVENQNTYASFSDHPTLMLPSLEQEIARLEQMANNGGNAGTTPRQAAPNGSAPRNEPAVTGNPVIGRRTPDQTPTRRTSGSAAKYTQAEIEKMPQGQFEALLEQHGAKTTIGLIERGVVI